MLVHEGELFAIGSFGTNQRIARWNATGQVWEPLGAFPPNSGVSSIVIHNGDLVAAGIGGIGVNESVWRWDFDNPGVWHPVGQHLGYNVVHALAVYNGDLIAGGTIGAGAIVRFNGTTWETLGGGLFLSNDLLMDSLIVFDLRVYNGELVVAGSFGHAGEQQYSPGSVTAYHLARWNGQSWFGFDGLVNGLNEASVTLHEHAGQLVIGGWFDMAGGRPNGYWARWEPTGCAPADVNCDTTVDILDVAPFVAGLLDPNGLDACAYPAVDVNLDGALNGNDVTGFVACVLAGGCP